jgi:hypothetical protein
VGQVGQDGGGNDPAPAVQLDDQGFCRAVIGPGQRALQEVDLNGVNQPVDLDHVDVAGRRGGLLGATRRGPSREPEGNDEQAGDHG